MSTNGELAERQGTAMLTRRDLRVGQVRLLHSPPLPVDFISIFPAYPDVPTFIPTSGGLKMIKSHPSPFLSKRDWLIAIAAGTAIAVCLGAFYVGMLWLGGG